MKVVMQKYYVYLDVRQSRLTIANVLSNAMEIKRLYKPSLGLVM